jgi:tRNA (guanine37-N1)-methyltransferase
MHFAYITIFPQLIETFLETSLIGKAVKQQVVSVGVENPRDYSDPPHYKVDDVPYGGGPGMVMCPEPLNRAIERVRELHPNTLVVYPCAAAPLFDQSAAESLARVSSITFLCGRYEGVDQRLIDSAVDATWSIGSYVLMGGEVAAMAMTEAVARLVPKVMGNDRSSECESFQKSGDQTLLEAPQFTRPALWRGIAVPEVLLSGNHARIGQWRHQAALEVTKKLRPDLLEQPE